jgi:hypothetical protein
VRPFALLAAAIRGGRAHARGGLLVQRTQGLSQHAVACLTSAGKTMGDAIRLMKDTMNAEASLLTALQP